MTNFYDVFISYGRKDSKAFSQKLRASLDAAGFKVWFDFNDIPLAVDFQNQIDDGIEKSHNFLTLTGKLKIVKLADNSTIDWDPSLYEDRHKFVWEYATDLIDLLSPSPGERILDLGCGTGQLTALISQSGAEVVGMDKSKSMIYKAKQNYPEIDFRVGDGANFRGDRPFDALFSNAALHWITESESAVACICQSLNSKGRFIAEFGGKGNMSNFISAVESTLKEFGYARSNLSPWFFPSIGEYATLLEKHGFHVSFAKLFSRPTVLESGEKGFHNWVRMFGKAWLEVLPESQIDEFLDRCALKIRDTAFIDSHWIADYRRLRIQAIKL